MSQMTHLPPSVVPRGGTLTERFSVPFKPRRWLERTLWAERSIALRLLPGVAATGAAALFGVPLLGTAEHGLAVFAFFPAVALAALFGRFAGGLLATFLSLAVASIWIVPLQGASGLVGLLPFLVASAGVIFLAEALHRVRGQAYATALKSAEYLSMAAVSAENEALLNTVLSKVGDGIITIDERGTIITVNPAATEMFGYSPEEVKGRTVNLLMPEGCRKAHDRYIAAHLKTGKVDTVCRRRQVDGLRKDGTTFPMECGVTDVCFDGRHMFVGIVRDITEQKNAENALRASEEFSRTVLESSADCIEVMDCEGRIEYVNSQGVRLMEASSPAAITGKLWADMWPPRERQAVEATIAKANSGETSRFSAYLPTMKGTPKCWDVLAAPVRDSEGRIRKLVATARDVTEAKESEEQIKLLLHEVSHRSKNLFAVVQAVTLQMGRGEESKDFAGRLGERLAALAKSHDLLVKSEWRGVDIGELVLSQLAHFKDLIGSRVLLEGPPAQLIPAAAQSLGMALHELATNAVKYGALSTAEGKVHVAWAIAQSDEGRYFRMRWSEEGGGPVSRPQRRGFGPTVLVRLAERALGGKVILGFPPSGLVWLLSAPAGNVVEASMTRH